MATVCALESKVSSFCCVLAQFTPRRNVWSTPKESESAREKTITRILITINICSPHDDTCSAYSFTFWEEERLFVYKSAHCVKSKLREERCTLMAISAAVQNISSRQKEARKKKERTKKHNTREKRGKSVHFSFFSLTRLFFGQSLFFSRQNLFCGRIISLCGVSRFLFSLL